MATMEKKFVPDHRFEGAPKLPWDRPPTRNEVWAHATHYFADIKTPDELKDFARNLWIGNYVFWVNVRGWRRQPDWSEGEAVFEGACPTGPIFPDQMHRVVSDLDRIARQRRAA